MRAACGRSPRSSVQRTKPAAPEAQQKGGLSDSAVRVLMTYAFSIIPEEQPGPDGKPVKLDKSDPNKFLIPDARCAPRDPCGHALGLCRGLRAA